MPIEVRPLLFKPHRVNGLSDRLLISHYENNYGGALRRLNAIQARLQTLDWPAAPVFEINGMKREELIAAGSVILHEIYFDALGGEGGDPPPGIGLAEALERDFSSLRAWHAEFTSMAKVQAGGSGWALLSWSPRLGRLVNQWAADHAHGLAGAVPVLALDIYEHSYHMDFGTRAAAYVDAVMANLQWERIAARYRQARHGEAEDAALFTASGAPTQEAAVISAEELRDAMHRDPPVLVDVCMTDDLDRRGDMLAGATLRNPDAIDRWAETLPRNRPIVAVLHLRLPGQRQRSRRTAQARLRRAVAEGRHRGMACDRRPDRAARPRKLPHMMRAVWLMLLLALPAQAAEPLVLEKTIALHGVRGRIDHMAFDPGRKRLIVAELGNDTVDVIDVVAGVPLHRFTGLREPQGVGYAERADVILIANAGDGSVRLFKAADFSPAGAVSLGDDADNVRIDPRNGLAVIGYGSGGLALIDPASHAKVADIPLPAHPEGFQIDPATGRAYVNIPDARQIAVVDLDARRVTATWPTKDAHANFPMALDPSQSLLASVFRSPPVLLLQDIATGTERQKLPICGDADDVFFDPRRARIYVSCGAGELAVLERGSAGWHALDPVRTASGARTSLFVPELDRLFVAERAGLLGSDAAIGVYRPLP